jgi:hypothetical protein
MSQPLDSRERIHLDWMFENQPDLVRFLQQSNQLRPHLEEKYQQALRLVDKLKQEGHSEEEAFQVAQESVLAPADGPAMSDKPPNPLPYREQKAALRHLGDE